VTNALGIKMQFSHYTQSETGEPLQVWKTENGKHFIYGENASQQENTQNSEQIRYDGYEEYDDFDGYDNNEYYPDDQQAHYAPQVWTGTDWENPLEDLQYYDDYDQQLTDEPYQPIYIDDNVMREYRSDDSDAMTEILDVEEDIGSADSQFEDESEEDIEEYYSDNNSDTSHSSLEDFIDFDPQENNKIGLFVTSNEPAKVQLAQFDMRAKGIDWFQRFTKKQLGAKLKFINQ
jgi:hypothetical protein